jgi:hypothetical protein
MGWDALLVVLHDAQPVRDPRLGDVTGWRVACYDVKEGTIIEVSEANHGGPFGPKLYDRPQYTNFDAAAVTAALAAFGVAMLDYAAVASDAVRAELTADYVADLRRAQRTHEALREAAAAELIGVHTYYRALLSEVRARLARPGTGLEIQQRLDALLDEEFRK